METFTAGKPVTKEYLIQNGWKQHPQIIRKTFISFDGEKTIIAWGQQQTGNGETHYACVDENGKFLSFILKDVFFETYWGFEYDGEKIHARKFSTWLKYLPEFQVKSIESEALETYTDSWIAIDNLEKGTWYGIIRSEVERLYGLKS